MISTPLTKEQIKQGAEEIYRRLETLRQAQAKRQGIMSINGVTYYLRPAYSTFKNENRWSWSFVFRGTELRVFCSQRQKPSGMKGVRSQMVYSYWFSKALSLEGFVELRMLIP